MYENADDSEWMRASIIATSVTNVHLDKKDRLKPDHFVPKRTSTTATPEAPKRQSLDVLKAKAQMISALAKGAVPRKA